MSNEVAAIVLAAGGSTRLGRPKQLVVINGETLVHAAVRAAIEGGCAPVCVITGHVHEAVERALAGLAVTPVHNENWQRGMGTSVRLGVERVKMASGVLLLTCDQLAVNGAVVRGLIQRRKSTGKQIMASEYDHTLGTPALFDRSCFSELLSISDERGAKAVIQADLERVARFAFPEGALDLDVPEDLFAWEARRTGPAVWMPQSVNLGADYS